MGLLRFLLWDAVLPLKINAENLGRCFKFTLVKTSSVI
ncbi:hypothetical protein SPIRO4BDMA_80151 [uncultured spirochete]|uniref:Uncharacterized protein n=1 Tax=uncultured spirochete TaxID=156406 RepID=A0A3P3XV31_9SPIR|nr:hypothetical protein SPIRO4BDMA_80151 [uncultured spirochete]